MDAKYTAIKQLAYASQYAEWAKNHPNCVVLSVSAGANSGIIILYVPEGVFNES